MNKPSHPHEHPLTLSLVDAPKTQERIGRGSACPRCGQARLDYNGLLELECPACGYRLAAGSACT